MTSSKIPIEARTTCRNDENQENGFRRRKDFPASGKTSNLGSSNQKTKKATEP